MLVLREEMSQEYVKSMQPADKILPEHFRGTLNVTLHDLKGGKLVELPDPVLLKESKLTGIDSLEFLTGLKCAGLSASHRSWLDFSCKVDLRSCQIPETAPPATLVFSVHASCDSVTKLGTPLLRSPEFTVLKAPRLIYEQTQRLILPRG